MLENIIKNKIMPYGDKKSYSFFKMKGHVLPGINQRSEGNTDTPGGRSKSSAFQKATYTTETKESKGDISSYYEDKTNINPDNTVTYYYKDGKPYNKAAWSKEQASS